MQANAYEAAGRHDLALAQYDKFIETAGANRGTALNNRCWYRASYNLDVKSGLADCDASIALNSNSSNLDSRGLAYLRLGNLAKARADYDAALAAEPSSAASLYGRALVRQQSGDAKGAAADLAAARARDRHIDERFGWMGLKAKT